MISFSTPYKIPFYDVDAYQVVWHGHYPKYWEVARCHLLQEIGIPYDEMQKNGYSFPVVEMHVKYIKPLVFGQCVEFSATLVEWQNRLKITYLVKDVNSGEICTKGSTKQIAVSMADKVTQFVSPTFLTEKVATWLNEHGH